MEINNENVLINDLPFKSTLSLDQDSIQLWLVDPDSITDKAILETFSMSLSVEEAESMTRFRLAKDAHRYLVTRALVREVLSRYTRIPPSHLRFDTNSWGRPELCSDQTTLPIRFNISHTSELIACALTLESDIGVDTEKTFRSTELLDILDTLFSPLEINYLRSLEAQEFNKSMMKIWTLKESYLKARGCGLSKPLDQFSVIPTDSGIHFQCADDYDPHINDWRFTVIQPTREHILAIALRSPDRTNIQLEILQWNSEFQITWPHTQESTGHGVPWNFA